MATRNCKAQPDEDDGQWDSPGYLLVAIKVALTDLMLIWAATKMVQMDSPTGPAANEFLAAKLKEHTD